MTDEGRAQAAQQAVDDWFRETCTEVLTFRVGPREGRFYPESVEPEGQVWFVADYSPAFGGRPDGVMLGFNAVVHDSTDYATRVAPFWRSRATIEQAQEIVRKLQAAISRAQNPDRD